MPNSGASRSLFWSVALWVVAVDIVTKLAAVTYLSPFPQPVLGRVLQLQLVYNRGAAFGLSVGPNSRFVFAALAVLAIGVLIVMMRHTDPRDRPRLTALGLIAGGAMGNLLDRLRHSRGVVDFLDVGIGSYRWPTFNLADLAVVTGAILLAGILWHERPPGRSADDGDRRAHA